MNLNNMSDEELDRLFKTSAENFDPPFDPQAWKAMNQRLEQVQVRQSWFRRYYPFLFLISLIPIGIFPLYKLVETPAKRLEQSEVSPNEVNDVVSYNKLKEHQESKTNKIGVVSPVPSKNAFSNPELAKTGKSFTKNKDLPEWITSQKNAFEKASISTLPTHAILDKSTTSTKKSRKAEDVINKGNDPAYILGKSEDVVLHKDTTVHSKIDIEKFAVKDTVKISDVLSQDDQANILVDSSKQESVSSQSGKKSWFLSSVQIAVAIAPDITTVKFQDPEAVSANAGIIIGVPLTKRLSLITGVVWANKVYYANPEEYHFSNGYTYTSPIDATCRVLDIPVNVRYQVLESGNNTLAVQAGLSSYLMLHEKYSSDYGGYVSYSYEVQNENKHVFQVQNVSLVYTRTISSVFSVGVEPFVKVPYSGIGAGRVKLTSAGVFFTAGYTIKLKQ